MISMQLQHRHQKSNRKLYRQHWEINGIVYKKNDISCSCEEKAKADASIPHNWHRFDFDSCSLHRFGEERAYSISGLYTPLINLKRCIVFAVMHNREGVRKKSFVWSARLKLNRLTHTLLSPPPFGQWFLIFMLLADKIMDIFLTPFLKSPSFNQYCLLI